MVMMSESPLSGLCTFLTRKVHVPLALGGKTYVVGVFPSALDALISAVQIVAGVTLTLLSGFLSIVFPQFKCLENATEGAWMNVRSGAKFLKHDLLNIFSLTVWGNYAKKYPKPFIR